MQLDQFVQSLWGQLNIRNKTKKNYVGAYTRNLRPTLGSSDIKEITKNQLIDAMSKLSPQSKYQTLMVARVIFREARPARGRWPVRSSWGAPGLVGEAGMVGHHRRTPAPPASGLDHLGQDVGAQVDPAIDRGAVERKPLALDLVVADRGPTLAALHQLPAHAHRVDVGDDADSSHSMPRPRPIGLARAGIPPCAPARHTAPWRRRPTSPARPTPCSRAWRGSSRP